MKAMHEMGAKEFLRLWKRVWAHVCHKLKGILGLDEASYEILKKGQVAELAACIPFWSGCPAPLRKAFYITLPLVADAVGHDILDARDGDYAEDRLRRIEEIGLICAGGDKARVAQGLNRLAACMYWDCLHDLELDQVAGKPTPGEDYAKKALAALKAERKPDPVYDKIMPKVDIFWWWGD
jgi:hypothetical protein